MDEYVHYQDPSNGGKAEESTGTQSDLHISLSECGIDASNPAFWEEQHDCSIGRKHVVVKASSDHWQSVTACRPDISLPKSLLAVQEKAMESIPVG